MATAVSLHIGLNRIDPKHYGTDGALSGCVNDANAMQAIAAARGFKTTRLLDQQATSQRILGWLDAMARTLVAGDTAIVTYAGHGSQVADTNNPPETDGRDETWCAYDRMVIDDELARCWSRFKPGVRILLVSDSCHSATVARQLEILSRLSESVHATRNLAVGNELPLIGQPFGQGDAIERYRVLPDEFRKIAEGEHQQLYAELQDRGPGAEDITIAATVLSLTACQDDQTAGDGSGHGVFTQALLDAWADGAFRGTYRQFFTAIKAGIRTGRQTPGYRVDGSANEGFEAETPFSNAATGSTSTETHMPNTERSIEERFEAALRGSNGSRQHTETSNGNDFCRMELLVPRDLIIGRSDTEVADFLQRTGAATLLKAYLTATSVKMTTRPLEGSISCGGSSKGDFGCKGEISIRF